MTAPRHTFPFLGQSRVVTVSATSLPASEPPSPLRALDYEMHRQIFRQISTQFRIYWALTRVELVTLRRKCNVFTFGRYIKNLLYGYFIEINFSDDSERFRVRNDWLFSIFLFKPIDRIWVILIQPDRNYQRRRRSREKRTNLANLCDSTRFMFLMTAIQI